MYFLLKCLKRMIDLQLSDTLFDKVLARKQLQRCLARSAMRDSFDSARRIFFGVIMQYPSAARITEYCSFSSLSIWVLFLGRYIKQL